jgi:hypothetical protein
MGRLYGCTVEDKGALSNHISFLLFAQLICSFRLLFSPAFPHLLCLTAYHIHNAVIPIIDRVDNTVSVILVVADNHALAGLHAIAGLYSVAGDVLGWLQSSSGFLSHGLGKGDSFLWLKIHCLQNCNNVTNTCLKNLGVFCIPFILYTATTEWYC